MFYVPVDEPQGMAFFLKDIFPLFEMVSPEIKHTYSREYALAKAAVYLTQVLHLESAVRLFVSGFGIVAKK